MLLTVAATPRRLGPGYSVGRWQLLSANLRPFRIYLSQQIKGVFLPRPSFERQIEAVASLFDFRFRDGGEV